MPSGRFPTHLWSTMGYEEGFIYIYIILFCPILRWLMTKTKYRNAHLSANAIQGHVALSCHGTWTGTLRTKTGFFCVVFFPYELHKKCMSKRQAAWNTLLCRSPGTSTHNRTFQDLNHTITGAARKEYTWKLIDTRTNNRIHNTDRYVAIHIQEIAHQRSTGESNNDDDVIVVD